MQTTDITEINIMTTIELLKEVQRVQLECMIHRLPVHINVGMMPEFGQIDIYVHGSDHEVIWSGRVSDHPIREEEVETIYNQFTSVISEYTVVRQAC